MFDMVSYLIIFCFHSDEILKMLKKALKRSAYAFLVESITYMVANIQHNVCI